MREKAPLQSHEGRASSPGWGDFGQLCQKSPGDSTANMPGGASRRIHARLLYTGGYPGILPVSVPGNSALTREAASRPFPRNLAARPGKSPESGDFRYSDGAHSGHGYLIFGPYIYREALRWVAPNIAIISGPIAPKKVAPRVR